MIKSDKLGLLRALPEFVLIGVAVLLFVLGIFQFFVGLMAVVIGGLSMWRKFFFRFKW